MAPFGFSKRNITLHSFRYGCKLTSHSINIIYNVGNFAMKNLSAHPKVYGLLTNRKAVLEMPVFDTVKNVEIGRCNTARKPGCKRDRTGAVADGDKRRFTVKSIRDSLKL